jgi:hypothetical protein
MESTYIILQQYPKCALSKDGKIKNIKTNQIIQQTKSKDGYLIVGLYDNDGWHVLKVHRLLASYFLENPDSKPFVDHIDGNKLNNNLDNLRWCANKEN